MFNEEDRRSGLLSLCLTRIRKGCWRSSFHVAGTQAARATRKFSTPPMLSDLHRFRLRAAGIHLSLSAVAATLARAESVAGDQILVSSCRFASVPGGAESGRTENCDCSRQLVNKTRWKFTLKRLARRLQIGLRPTDLSPLRSNP